MKNVIVGHPNPDVDSILGGVLLERILNRIGYRKKEYKFLILDNNIDEITRRIVEGLGVDISSYQEGTIDDCDEVILVDHYDGKGLKDYYEKFIRRVKAIYDHHPIPDDFNFVHKPDIFFSSNSCSSTTVIAKAFDEFLTRKDFILVIVGALVDTVSFHSTRTNQEEVNYLLKKCSDFGIDINNYFELGLCLNDLNNIQADSFNGLKECKLKGKKIRSSYIQIKNVFGNKEKIAQIIEILKDHIKKNNIDIFVFLVHDMDSFKTTEYDIYSDRVEIIEWEEYASRGNTVMPNLEKKLSSGTQK